MLEVDEGIGGPQALLKLFASDHFAGLFEQNGEDLERAVLELDANAGFANFASRQIDLEGAEPYNPRIVNKGWQSFAPSISRQFTTSRYHRNRLR